MAPEYNPDRITPYRCICGGTSCNGTLCRTYERQVYVDGRWVTTEKRWRDGSRYIGDK